MDATGSIEGNQAGQHHSAGGGAKPRHLGNLNRPRINQDALDKLLADPAKPAKKRVEPDDRTVDLINAMHNAGWVGGKSSQASRRKHLLVPSTVAVMVVATAIGWFGKNQFARKQEQTVQLASMALPSTTPAPTPIQPPDKIELQPPLPMQSPATAEKKIVETIPSPAEKPKDQQTPTVEIKAPVKEELIVTLKETKPRSKAVVKTNLTRRTDNQAAKTASKRIILRADDGLSVSEKEFLFRYHRQHPQG